MNATKAVDSFKVKLKIHFHGDPLAYYVIVIIIIVIISSKDHKEQYHPSLYDIRLTDFLTVQFDFAASNRLLSILCSANKSMLSLIDLFRVGLWVFQAITVSNDALGHFVATSSTTVLSLV